MSSSVGTTTPSLTFGGMRPSLSDLRASPASSGQLASGTRTRLLAGRQTGRSFPGLHATLFRAGEGNRTPDLFITRFFVRNGVLTGGAGGFSGHENALMNG